MRVVIVCSLAPCRLLVMPMEAVAQVKVGIGPEGRKLLYNDQMFNASQASRTLISPRQDLMTLIERYAEPAWARSGVGPGDDPGRVRL